MPRKIKPFTLPEELLLGRAKKYLVLKMKPNSNLKKIAARCRRCMGHGEIADGDQQIILIGGCTEPNRARCWRDVIYMTEKIIAEGWNINEVVDKAGL